jgi:hypothetical protein
VSPRIGNVRVIKPAERASAVNGSVGGSNS